MNALTSPQELSREEAIQRVASTPLLLHFHAPACPASQDLSLILAEVAERYKGELEFKQINVEESLTRTAQFLVKYQVLSLPTLLLLDKEMPLVRIRGFISKQKLEQIINQFL